MTDIVQRLRMERRATAWRRGLDCDFPTAFEQHPLCQEAAAEITRLRAEAEALRKALAAIVDRDFTFFDGCVDRNTITYGEIQQARSALDATKGTDMTDTRQALAALLPCPFCGNSKGLAVANENPQDLSGGYFIACPSCDASTGLRFACGEDPIPLLIEQWNRRAALSAPPVQQRVWDEFGRTNSGDETGGAVQRFGFDISRSKPEIIPATCGAFVYFDDYLALHKKLAAQAAPEPSAQPVAGAVATDETGWLIEHSGEILPGAEQRAQVSWLRVQMKFNGYGAREFGFTHDANEALRFARKEDAEAVLAMHLGASPPDWYSKPFSVTEHMWPAASQAQAAPAPEPSAQPVAGAVATEANEEIQELRAQVQAWRKQCDTLTNQVICCGVAARHPDATLTTRGAYAGKWNSPQAEEVRKLRAERDALLAAAPQPAPSAQAVAHPSHQTVREWMPVSEALRLSDLWTAGDLDNCGQWRAAIKVLADEVRALAASPQPEPSAQGEQVATVTEKMVTAYLTANDAYWKRIDGEPTKIGKWRNGTPSEATRVSLMAALASAPSIPPHAVVEAVPLEVDYDALIAAAFKLHRYRQGTGACIAFKHGAEWMREQMERGIAPKAAQEKT